MDRGYSLPYVRTAVFTTLLLSNVVLTFLNRSFEEIFWKTVLYKNKLVPYILLISAFFLGVILFVQPVRVLFQFTAISSRHYLACLVVSLVCTVWVDFYKHLLKKSTITPDSY